MKRFVAVFLLAGGLLVAGGANALVTITLTDSGSGTISISSQGTIDPIVCSSTSSVSAFDSFAPRDGSVSLAGAPVVQCLGVTITGAAFGTGGNVIPTYISGARWGFQQSTSRAFFPSGFTSSTSLATEASVVGSFSSFGITPGTYTYQLTNGPNLDTIAVIVNSPTPSAVPTLSEWSQMLLALMVLTMIGWHFRKQQI